MSNENGDTMSSERDVYIERNPSDLITAEDWNDLQRQIQDDIESTASEAADGVKHVASADDASQLDGMDVDELTDEITKRVLGAVQTESGYRKVFKILEEPPLGSDMTADDIEFNIIEHDLGSCPLVDVYKLQYFEVVCADDDDIYPAIATFYLHHTTEEKLRVTPVGGGDKVTVNIQGPGDLTWGIPFADMLAHYDVQYSNTTSLGDLETEFWKAFFSGLNDKFDDEQYCHSPWFERCCREERDVASLKSKGDWNDLVFQVRPWKIVSGPVRESSSVGPGGNTNPGFEFDDEPVPANVGVAHLDLNRVALWLHGPALHGGNGENGVADANGVVTGGLVPFPPAFQNEMKIMVLLRV